MQMQTNRNLVALLLPLVLVACNRAAEEAPAASHYSTDVIGVEEQHLSADYWIARMDAAQSIIMDQAAIATMNDRTFATDETMVDLRAFPDRITQEDLRARIGSISRRPGSERFHENGRPVDGPDLDAYEQLLNLDNLAAFIPTRYGLVTARSDLRTFPTRDRIFMSPPPNDLDRFQEHALFPGEGVAVLHQSTDGQWLFVQSYNYAAWIAADKIAYTDRATMLRYLSAPQFLVVTGGKIATAFNPQVATISELQLDMGVRLPLVSAGAAGHDIHGQNPFASHIVRLPTREPDGNLKFELALIPRSRDVSIGYLPYTTENVIRQAFKFLGERYGWGHSYNGRDCTGFVSEVFKTFGLLMPRNSGDQGRSAMGENRRFAANATPADKKSALAKLVPGNLIYIPGHVMMHIGYIEDRPHIIHDVYGLSYNLPDGTLYRGVLAGVSVTPLLPMRLSGDSSYVDRIYNIKSLNGVTK